MITKICLSAKYWFISWCCLSTYNSFAFEQSEIELESGSVISSTRYIGDGTELLLWLPSERGLRGAYQPIAMDLSALGTDVWAIDLHASYMVPESRTSLAEFKREDLLLLLEYAEKQGYKSLTFITAGRGAALALEVARLWQTRYPDSQFLKGYIFFTPHLLDGQAAMGQKAKYKSIAGTAILPIYLIQPEYSTKFARSKEISEMLSESGSQVFTHLLKGVAGGFHMRPEEDLSADDLAAKAKLAGIVEKAMKLMTGVKVAKRISADEIPSIVNSAEVIFGNATLQIYKGDKKAPPLTLKSLYGGDKSLFNYEGKVVLLNFWASWCGPCVREIPSLSRLVEKFKDKPFAVVTINIGEPEAHIKRFVKDLPVNFEILLDDTGKTVLDWNVYAYPSNFLLDQAGNITHAYRGALEWDSPEVVEVIEAALKKGGFS